MKKFTIEVPETKGVTNCKECPWQYNNNVCDYCNENNLCRKYNFSKLHIWDDIPSKRESLEIDNTEFDYGHNVSHKEYYGG